MKNDCKETIEQIKESLDKIQQFDSATFNGLTTIELILKQLLIK
jgi:hypothetical protein